MALHVDTDFLVHALETAGWERRRPSEAMAGVFELPALLAD